MDLLYEVGLRLGDNCLDFENLLINNLVDLFHMVEHLVSLVIECIKLALVALQLLLTAVHLLS